MMGEVPVGEARENVVKDWKKAIGKEVRRNRTGKVAGEFSVLPFLVLILSNWIPPQQLCRSSITEPTQFDSIATETSHDNSLRR
jgi:hypothetical protein